MINNFMMLDPGKLEPLIARLNQLFHEGTQCVLTYSNGYPNLKDKSLQNITLYTNVAQSVFIAWRDSVVKTLVDTLGFGREESAMRLVKTDAISLVNYPEQLGNAILNHKYRLGKLEEIIVQLEEKLALSVRKEIAEKEYDADIVYQLDYNPTRRLIILNKIEWHTLNMDSVNHKFFEYLWARPNQEVTADELRKNAGMGDRKVSNILADLGFVDNLKLIFFPQANDKGTVQLLPIIRKQDIYRGNLPVLTRDNILELAEKKKKSSKKD